MRAFRIGSFTAPRHVCGRFGLGTTFGSSTAFGVAVYWFRTQPRSEGAGHKKRFMDSKGDGKHFFWLVFLACLSSACCGVWPFRIRCPRASFGSSTAFGVAVYWFRTQPRSEGAGHKKCFMDSKGDGKHFFWLVFLACLSSACCGVWPFKLQFRHRVEGLRTHRFWLARARLVVAFGLFGSVASSFSDPASQRGCWPQEMFYGFQR